MSNLSRRNAAALGAAAFAALVLPLAGSAQTPTHDAGFTVEQAISMAMPYSLVAAQRADRVAWLEMERGMRNVFTAAAPDWKRVRLTSYLADDGVDMTSVQISDDGSVVTYIRGHNANFKGQIGNQGNSADGGHREIWAVGTNGKRAPWRVVSLDPSPREDMAPTVARVAGAAAAPEAPAAGGRGGGRGGAAAAPGAAVTPGGPVAGQPGTRAAAADPAAGGGGGGGGGRGGAENRLSPDGRWVLFVKDGQIHRASVDPGNSDASEIDAQPPFFTTLGVNSDPVWSPDSKQVAFVTGRYDERQYFPTQGQVTTHSLIGVYDVDSRTISYLDPTVDRDTSPTWSADGKQIAYIRRPGLPFGHFATARLQTIGRDQVPAGFLTAKFAGGYNTSFMVADAATGTAHEVWHNTPTDNVFARVAAIDWQADRLVFEGTVNTWRRWYSVALSNAAADPVLLTPGDAAIEHQAFSPDGKWLYWSSNLNEPDRRHLWRVSTAGGQPQSVTSGQMVETAVAVPGSGQSIAIEQSGPKQPVTVAVMPAAGGAVKLIGSPPPEGFPGAKNVVPTSIELTAADGVKSRAILFLPADLKPGDKRAALLYNHGGGGRSVLGYPDQVDGYYHITYGLIQYFVNKGYIVLAVNYRGDALYNPDFNEPKEYGAEGVSEYRDVLAAGEYLKARPDVDPARIGVWGLSYGGWLTGEALSRNSDLFKAGAIHAGVQMRSTSMDPTNLAFQSSPAFNIEKWTSPTLIAHGDDDRNVEFSQTIGIIQLLRARNVPHKLMVFPDETHYYMKFNRWPTEFSAIDQWFDQWLQHKQPTTTTAQGAEK